MTTFPLPSNIAAPTTPEPTTLISRAVANLAAFVAFVALPIKFFAFTFASLPLVSPTLNRYVFIAVVAPR